VRRRSQTYSDLLRQEVEQENVLIALQRWHRGAFAPTVTIEDAVQAERLFMRAIRKKSGKIMDKGNLVRGELRYRRRLASGVDPAELGEEHDRETIAMLRGLRELLDHPLIMEAARVLAHPAVTGNQKLQRRVALDAARRLLLESR
jgi:hypothetical protein